MVSVIKIVNQRECKWYRQQVGDTVHYRLSLGMTNQTRKITLGYTTTVYARTQEQLSKKNLEAGILPRAT